MIASAVLFILSYGVTWAPAVWILSLLSSGAAKDEALTVHVQLARHLPPEGAFPTETDRDSRQRFADGSSGLQSCKTGRFGRG